MPTKIIPGTSNPANGEINQQELLSIMKDFKDNIQVTCPASRPIVKTNGANIPFWLLKKLMDDSFNKDGDASKYVSINFAISLPDQKNCMDDFSTTLPNHLTVVINIAKKEEGTFVERTNVDDEIITLGFKPQPNEIPAPANNINLGLLAAAAAPVDCCANPKISN